ncbi:hypothetical protein [Pendulispora albinea]|uniref:Uncharacterized protein n=1 Tax=Pendulispora albinea TaxID=2741071 RepID=A0ABZ2M877_9BACT
MLEKEDAMVVGGAIDDVAGERLASGFSKPDILAAEPIPRAAAIAIGAPDIGERDEVALAYLRWRLGNSVTTAYGIVSLRCDGEMPHGEGGTGPYKALAKFGDVKIHVLSDWDTFLLSRTHVTGLLAKLNARYELGESNNGFDATGQEPFVGEQVVALFAIKMLPK